MSCWLSTRRSTLGAIILTGLGMGLWDSSIASRCRCGRNSTDTWGIEIFIFFIHIRILFRLWIEFGFTPVCTGRSLARQLAVIKSPSRYNDRKEGRTQLLHGKSTNQGAETV